MNYRNYDLPDLLNRLNTVLPTRLDIDDNKDLGSLILLAQHYSFPTPLLDWTLSPYIAAFFAITDKNVNSTFEFFRIYILKNCKEFSSPPHIDCLKPNLAFANYVVLNNERYYPQQSVTLLSTVEDIENQIHTMEHITNQSLLSAIDIPTSEIINVKKDLFMMGITHESLFPSIEGICKTVAMGKFSSEKSVKIAK